MHDSAPLKDASLAEDGRYRVRVASTAGEIESAFRLRHDVFVRELGSGQVAPNGRESDGHDQTCEHLIVIEKETGRTIGTYRMKSIEAAGGTYGFYSNTEFTLESMPAGVLDNGIEVGRACIAAEHRNTRAIFLLWRALAQRMRQSGKRYFFGCCSMFTRDLAEGEAAYQQLCSGGFTHDRFVVEPRHSVRACPDGDVSSARVKLPGLFEMYLRVGARVCGPPAYDEEFGTVDFFVVFDLEAMEPKYRRLFLD